MEELYSEWAQPRREALRRRWMGALLQLAELRVKRGALSSAIEPLDRLLMSDPTHETAVRQLMMVLMGLDRRVEALQAYQRLTEVLEREYGSEPLPETRRLYEALRNGELMPAPSTAFLTTLAGPGAALASAQAAPSVGFQTGPSPDDGSTSATTRPAVTGMAARTVANPHFPSGRHKRTPLIGRERELALMRQLLSHWHPVRSTVRAGEQESAILAAAKAQQTSPAQLSLSPPHFVLLTGEAGIGKTRLAEELSDEAGRQGWQVVWSRSYEQEGAIPYCPWVELLRTLLQGRLTDRRLSSAQLLTELGLSTSHLQRLCTLLPELYELLQPAVAPLVMPVEQERLHLWEATLSLLTALSRRAPLLLVLDDLHWADESSLELLSYLARHLREQPILLLGTCRDMELLPSHALRTLINDLQREQVLLTLAIQPLTAAQIAQLVSHLPARLVHSIQTQADGNPFFAEELARYLEREASEGGSASAGQAVAGEGRLSLPATIAAVLDRRLGKLSMACQALLSKAAVFGAPFEFNHLLFMDSGQLPHPQEEQVLDLLEEALRAGLLIEEENGRQVSYHFWHPLIESHLYQNLSVARRIQLHRRAADALLTLNPQREEEVAAAVTYHLIRGASDGKRIARYAERAANRAYRLAAYGEAQYYYRLALLALAGAPPPPPLERQAVVSADYLPSEADADPAPSLDQLLPSAGEEELLHFARLLEHVCECCMMQGNYSEARRLYARVLALRQRSLQVWERQQTEPGSELVHKRRQHEAQIQAIIWREMSLAWLRTGDFAQARLCLEEGKRALREANALESPASACLLLQEGNLSALEGNYDEARRQVEQMLTMLEKAMGHEPTPLAAGQEPPTLSERAIAGDPLELGHAHETLGVIAARLGHPSEALQHLHTALTIYEQHECLMAMAQICGNLGAAHALVADHQAARAYMRRALELTERTGDLPNMAFVTGNLGELARRCGDLREAETYFRRSLALAERTQEREHMAWCNIALAETLQSAGKLDEALRCLQRSLLTGRAIHHARTVAHARIVLAEVRLAQASAACLAYLRQHPLPAAEDHGKRVLLDHCRESCPYRRLLLRGQRALERALRYEGLDAEVAVEGRYLQACVAFLLNCLEVAKQITLDLLAIADRQENRLTLGHAHRLLARILAVQGEAEAAAAHFEQAARIFDASELILDYARTLHSYGAHLALLGVERNAGEQLARAFSYLREAQALFERAQAAIDLQWIETLLASWPSLPLLAAALKVMP